MKILLTGGGSGGHITPLLAVARELKSIDPNCEVLALCESGSAFIDLYKNEPAVDKTFHIPAGKFRRYSGRSLVENLTDVKTMARNVRDVGRVIKGYNSARKLLKREKPDAILVKGGFVGVPAGYAAARLNIPYMTHDSDSIPGLANRLISKKATLHATGMPAEFYDYDQKITVYTGVPISGDYSLVDENLKNKYKKELGLEACDKILMVVGGSQGGSQLNEDMVSISSRLMAQEHNLGILHIAGSNKVTDTQQGYKKELLADELRRVVVKGFVDDAYRYSGASDVVISRSSATVTAELAVQGKAVIFVPGRLAGDHQHKNASLFKKEGRAEMVEYGDREGLFETVSNLLSDASKRKILADKLHELAKPKAASELAKLVYELGKRAGN